MLPELFRIPFLDLPVHTYGALYVTGLSIGLFVAYRQALLGKKYFDDVLDYGFWALLGAILGARVMFIIVEWKYYFVERPFIEVPHLGFSMPTFLAVWQGGFVFWGGAVGGAIALYIFCKKRGIPLGQFADFCALGLPLGHAIGRLGCVAGGCCFGYASFHVDNLGLAVADTPFALSFPPGSVAYGALYNQASGQTLELMRNLGTTVPLFPVQLVEALGNILIFFILIMLTPKKHAHGQITLLYFILYSILRSLAETMRGDTARGFVIPDILSTSQFISVLVSTIALVVIVILSKKNKHYFA